MKLAAWLGAFLFVSVALLGCSTAPPKVFLQTELDALRDQLVIGMSVASAKEIIRENGWTIVLEEGRDGLAFSPLDQEAAKGVKIVGWSKSSTTSASQHSAIRFTLQFDRLGFLQERSFKPAHTFL